MSVAVDVLDLVDDRGGHHLKGIVVAFVLPEEVQKAKTQKEEKTFAPAYGPASGGTAASRLLARISHHPYCDTVQWLAFVRSWCV